jgi:hypothetical protein
VKDHAESYGGLAEKARNNSILGLSEQEYAHEKDCRPVKHGRDYPAPEHFHVKMLACDAFVVVLGFNLTKVSWVDGCLLIIQGYENLDVSQEGIVHGNQYFEEVDLTGVPTVHREPDLSEHKDHVLIEIVADHLRNLYVATEAILKDQVV